VIPLIAVIAYFWSIGALGQMVYYTITDLKGYGRIFSWPELLSEFESFSVVWIILSASLLAIGYKFIKKNIDWETFVALWLLVSLFPLVSRQYGHYFIQILPPACLLASLFITNLIPSLTRIKEIFSQHDSMRLFTLVCITILVIMSLGISGSVGYDMLSAKSPPYSVYSLQNQIQTADYIQSHTTNDDKILVYPYQPAIYFLSNRNPCEKILILQRPPINDKTEQELLEQITETSPKYVVWQTDTEGNIIQGLPQIDKFLENHFNMVKAIGNFDIYLNDATGP